jgi:hypothetical protein
LNFALDEGRDERSAKCSGNQVEESGLHQKKKKKTQSIKKKKEQREEEVLNFALDEGRDERGAERQGNKVERSRLKNPEKKKKKKIDFKKKKKKKKEQREEEVLNFGGPLNFGGLELRGTLYRAVTGAVSLQIVWTLNLKTSATSVATPRIEPGAPH